MSSLMQNYYPTFKMYQDVRNGLMNSLSDGDLTFSPGGENPNLGAAPVYLKAMGKQRPHQLESWIG